MGKDRWFSAAYMSGNKNWMVKVTQIVFKLNNLGGWTLKINGGHGGGGAFGLDQVAFGS